MAALDHGVGSAVVTGRSPTRLSAAARCGADNPATVSYRSIRPAPAEPAACWVVCNDRLLDLTAKDCLPSGVHFFYRGRPHLTQGKAHKH
jgi:hypothetical protein